MCVASHGYGGLGGDRDGGRGWDACGTKPGGMLGDAVALPQCEVMRGPHLWVERSRNRSVFLKRL